MDEIISAVKKVVGNCEVVEVGVKEGKGNYIDFDCRVLYKEDIEKIQEELDKKGIYVYITAFSSSFSKKLNKATQRIYFRFFNSLEEKEKFIKELEEAKRRDHRFLGEQLDLFHFEEEIIGSGLPLFHFNGAIIRNELINFIREINEELGFKEVFTPHLSKANLWKISGHYDKYKDKMFLWKQDEEEYGLKPMNCPMHLMIFKFKVRSYRDLPFRIAEFATVYRKEQSGELHGLSRVWSITQDDHHVILTLEQVKDEIKRIIEKVLYVYDKFNLKDAKLYLSTRPELYIGGIEEWNFAEEKLKEILKEIGVSFEIKEGEGAFYGPKIDFEAKDALGRFWQLTTIQLDFNLPRRFEITYVDKDGKEKYPVMIHFAILGSIERFMSIIIEHYAGRFPLWLAPIQVAVLPLSEKYYKESLEFLEELKKNKIRAEIFSEGTLEYRIRECEILKIPYIAVLGKKEVESGSVTIRYKGELLSLKREEFIKKLKEEISQRI
ncbi:MAG: threonine--tRNA ligase [Candidatus Aenigmatarchaeota archaeon]